MKERNQKEIKVRTMLYSFSLSADMTVTAALRLDAVSPGRAPRALQDSGRRAQLWSW